MTTRDHFRAHSRRKVDLAALVRDRSGAMAHGVRIRNLGLGGACVELSDEGTGFSAAPALAVEGTITIEVTAPTLWDPLTLRGKVAWVRHEPDSTQAGVRFEHRDAGSLYALFQLLGAHGYDS